MPRTKRKEHISETVEIHIIGPRLAGKTVLAALIKRLLAPFGYRVTIKDPNEVQANQTRKREQWIARGNQVFSERTNVVISTAQRGERADGN